MAVSRGFIEQLALVEFFTQRNSPGYPPEGVRKVRDSLLLTPSFGAVFYMRVDLGFPASRDDSQDNHPSQSHAGESERCHDFGRIQLRIPVVL